MVRIVLFLFNPTLGFLYSLKELTKRFSGFVFVAFYAIYGYAISFALTTADSYRIAQVFVETDYVGVDILTLYSSGSVTDLYLPFIFSIVKQFSTNPKVLFGVLGAVMGSFVYLSVRLFYRIQDVPRDRCFYICVCCFLLIASFFNVNGIRFWTATSFFFYFTTLCVYYDSKLAGIAVLLTPFFHFGFFVGIVAFGLYWLGRGMRIQIRKVYIFMVLAFGLSIFAHSGQNVIDGLLANSDSVDIGHSYINSKIKNYSRTSENIQRYSDEGKGIENTTYRQANNLFTGIFQLVNRVGIFILLSFLYKRRKECKLSLSSEKVLNWVLLMFAIGCIAVVFIGSGVRFINVANMFLLFYIALLYAQNRLFVKRFYLWLIVINFYNIAFLLFNSPRLVDYTFWIFSVPFTIIDGWGFVL